MSRRQRHWYEFGCFRLDVTEQALLRDGEPVALPPRVFDTLLVLLEHGGRLVEKEALMKAVWPETIVEEGNLSNNIFLLRKTLGEDAQQKYIETVPKRGYRFVAAVKERWDEPNEPTPAQLEPPFRTEGAAAKPRSWFRTRPLSVGLTCGVAVAGVAALSVWLWKRPLGTVPGPSVKSITVLPFQPLAEGAQDEYLGLGIADTLITKLSNIRQITVRPTTAVQKYAGTARNPLAAGREQRTDAVLEGNIQRAGERIRVSARLLRVSDGTALWSEQFDVESSDVFTAEDSICRRVAAALTFSLSPEEEKQLVKRYTASTEAYRAYVRGRYYSSTLSKPGLDQAIEHFKHAIELDPAYALAWAGLADAYTSLGLTYAEPRQPLLKAEAAAKQAQELDENLGWARAALATVAYCLHYDWPRAEREFKRALQLNANDAAIHHRYGLYLAFSGRTDEAHAHMKLAGELDPLSPLYQIDVGAPFYCARQYSTCLAMARRILEAYPDWHLAHFDLGLVYLGTGQLSEALAEFQRSIPPDGDPEADAMIGYVEALRGNRATARRILGQLQRQVRTSYVSPASIALIHAALDEKEKAFELLERAYQDRSMSLLLLKVDGRFDSLRPDPRFDDLVRRVGLAP